MIKSYWMKQDKINEGKNAGPSSGTPPKEETPPAASKDTPSAQAEGDNVDEFGYEKTPTQNKPAEEGTKPPEKKEEKATPKIEEKIDPVSGYGKDAPVAPKVEDPPATPKEEVKVDLGFELDVKDLEPSESKKLQEFAKVHKLTKEAAQALVNDRKAELKAADEYVQNQQKEQEKQIAKQKSDWHKELQTDPTFGGDKFETSLMKVEKVLQEFMPNTKKMLTERKSMLPPNVMRDLLSLSERLYGNEKLVQGEAGGANPPEKTDKEDSHLDFYN